MEQGMKERQVLQKSLDTDRPSKFTDNIEKLAVIDAFMPISQQPNATLQKMKRPPRLEQHSSHRSQPFEDHTGP